MVSKFSNIIVTVISHCFINKIYRNVLTSVQILSKATYNVHFLVSPRDKSRTKIATIVKVF